MSDADAVARSAARDFPTPAKAFSDNAARHRDVASRADDTAAASWPEGIPDAARIAASIAAGDPGVRANDAARADGRVSAFVGASGIVVVAASPSASRNPEGAARPTR